MDLSWALTTGDPLADAVVAEMAADRTVRAMLADGIVNGLGRDRARSDRPADRRRRQTSGGDREVGQRGPLPGAMRVGAHGYVATMQVRMLHARVRAAQSGGSHVPVNQVELARTWMDFLGLPKARLARGLLSAGVLYTRFRHWKVCRDPANRVLARQRGIAAAVAAADNEELTAYAKETV